MQLGVLVHRPLDTPQQPLRFKPRERSILNLGMIGALGKMEEFATHVRGALTNGLTPNEIRAALTQVTIYCGAPTGVDCFRVARPIIAEHEKNKK